MMRYDRFDSRLTIVCEFCRTRAMIVEDVIMPAACLCMLHAYTLYVCCMQTSSKYEWPNRPVWNLSVFGEFFYWDEG